MKELKMSDIPMQRIVGSIIGNASDQLKCDFSGCNTFDEIINDGHKMVTMYNIPAHMVSQLIHTLTEGFNKRAKEIGCEEVTASEIEMKGRLRFTPILVEIKHQVRILYFEYLDEVNNFINKYLKREDVMTVQNDSPFFYLYFWAPENIGYDSTTKEPFERKDL